jgi:hypothetical protein
VILWAEMNKIKLLDYQLQAIKARIDHSDSEVEDMILNKYKAHSLDDLNALDYDDIIDDIENFNYEANALDI